MQPFKHNNFYLDKYSSRSVRLDLMSRSINTYAVELHIPTDLLNWALDSASNYEDLLVKQGYERASSIVKLSNFKDSFAEARNIYSRCKGILLTRIKNDELEGDLAEEYSVDEPIPAAFVKFSGFVDNFKTANDRHEALGDGFAINSSFVDTLTAKRDEAKALWQEVLEQRQTATEKYNDFRELFEADTQKLRMVYQLAVMKWGKYDPKLPEMGFWQMSKRRGGIKPEPPIGLVWVAEQSKFQWEASEKATSYQLGLSSGGKKWEIVYTGKNTEARIELLPSWKLARVRARNKHGYGKWSDAAVI